MIQAIKHGKTKIEKKEDTLSSSFFGLLFYMPKEIINQFFIEITKNNEIGEYLNHEFWSHWNSIGTKNKYYVEPDIFVRFEKIDIIIDTYKERITIDKYSYVANLDEVKEND